MKAYLPTMEDDKVVAQVSDIIRVSEEIKRICKFPWLDYEIRRAALKTYLKETEEFIKPLKHIAWLKPTPPSPDDQLMDRETVDAYLECIIQAATEMRQKLTDEEVSDEQLLNDLKEYVEYDKDRVWNLNAIIERAKGEGYTYDY